MKSLKSKVQIVRGDPVKWERSTSSDIGVIYRATVRMTIFMPPKPTKKELAAMEKALGDAGAIVVTLERG